MCLFETDLSDKILILLEHFFKIESRYAARLAYLAAKYLCLPIYFILKHLI